MTQLLDSIPHSTRSRPMSAWSLARHAIEEQFGALTHITLSAQMALPKFHAIHLLARPELHRFLAKRARTVDDKRTAHLDESTKRNESASATYELYVEVHDYSHLERLDDDAEFVRAFMAHHDDVSRQFEHQLLAEEAHVLRRIERLYQRTAPIQVQERLPSRYEDVALRINDQPIHLTKYREDTYSSINVVARLPAELVPQVKWSSDLTLRLKDVMVGTPFIDLRITANASLSGRETWIDLESWTKVNAKQREQYQSRRAAPALSFPAQASAMPPQSL